jgi:isatin hydrolase
MSEVPPESITRQLVDLTLDLAEGLPCTWPGHIPFQQKTSNYFVEQSPEPGDPLRDSNGSYQTRWLLIDEHAGTHVDAPAHFLATMGTGLPNEHWAGSITVEQIPLSKMMGPAVVVDVDSAPQLPPPGVSPIISAENLVNFEQRHGRFSPGDVVIFRSGWDSRYLAGDAGRSYLYDPVVTRSSPGWPAPDASAINLLLDRGVECVGTDGVSMGPVQGGEEVHLLGLSHEMAFVEALGGLHRLPVRGAYFVFAPIKVRRGTGAPGRAFAWLP